MNYSIPRMIRLFIFLVGFVSFAQAQELLTVEEAVRIALENNYEIRLAKNELQIDVEGVSLGYAGILPNVQAQATDNNNIQDIYQVRSDGTVRELDNGKNNNLNYGVNLDWTLFDGFGMFARYDQLKELKNLGEAELQQAVLGRVADVMTTYFQLVQQKQELAALDSTLVISEQRVEFAQNRFTIGKASKLEVLNAQVDLNTDQTLLLRQVEEYSNTKTRLNEIIARDIETKFTVEDAMLVDQSLELESLEDKAKDQNPELQAQLINKRIAELQFKRVRANRYPVLVGTTGYNFNESESSLGFTTTSSSQGFNYGFTASVNIFDGFTQNRDEKIAKLQIENSAVIIEQQLQTLQSQLATAFQTYLTNVRLIELEQRNEAIAKENLDITLEKFKIGTIPTIEFRTAQLNYINAKVRYSEATYQAKLSEITLKQLAGSLTL
ncbi:TolC family protein [Flavimarina sp. Hel_I_48]|uniref:TolC family protein n=1 Tax=Flavimarina sp. Hel_I_48 TaxID=1392488 RepID=UPI0004DEF909|nr:TolC family protein [Flavimarina sp. Hel_I_48]